MLHSNSLAGHLETALAGRCARRPVVIHVHDLVRDGVGRQVLASSARLSSATLAISRAVGACVGEAGGRLYVAPNGVDTSRFRPGDPDPEVRATLTDDVTAPLVAVVGRVDRMKGVDVVVEAVATLRRDTGLPVRLVVVGDAFQDREYAKRTRDQAARLLGDSARFIPPREDVPEVLRAVDVLVNASSAEPFGLSVLEAQATGVPVVAAGGGGIPEFVSDGLTGLLFPPGDAAALAACLARVIGDPVFARQLATAARTQTVREFDLEVRADRLLRLYRQLSVGDMRPPPSVPADRVELTTR